MKVLILGSSGMLGQKLLKHLISSPYISGKQIESVTLADFALQTVVTKDIDFQVKSVKVDITEQSSCTDLISDRPDIVFHLAAVVSGEAEANFEKGYRVNLEGTQNFFEAIRKAGNDYCPKIIYTSSIAVYGGAFSSDINDDFILQPTTSYGTQKLIAESLLNDYSRKGYLNGIGIRLPTICVRPGKPNAAASGVFSNIIREPLVGRQAVLNVKKDTSMVFASPKSAVGFLIHGAEIDLSKLGNRRNLSMPGVHATIGEQIESLHRVAGEQAISLILEQLDPQAQRMVENWNLPPITADRARALGFACENSFDEIIKCHIKDELGGEIMGKRVHE